MQDVKFGNPNKQFAIIHNLCGGLKHLAMNPLVQQKGEVSLKMDGNQGQNNWDE